jgi:hypothetical protein
MEAVDIPSERVPGGLKACEQILKRGKEVRKVEPIVTYWCESSLAPYSCHSESHVARLFRSGTAGT